MRSTLLLLLLLAAAACARAGGDVSGGELTPEAGTLAVAPLPFDAGTDDDPCGDPNAIKWSEVYRDMFGPTGKPGSCSYISSCHGTAEGDGAKSSGGISCFDQSGCRVSMITTGLLTPGTVANPSTAPLLSALLRYRKPDGTVSGYMPNTPSYYRFPAACIARIQGWIGTGYPDN